MQNSHMTWVVTIDSSTCKIYQFKKPAHLTLLKEIEHPENRLRDIELTSSKPGRYKKATSARSAYSPPTDPKEVKVQEFSRQVANELEQGRNSHAYHDLILIAPPHMSGLLLQQVSKHVKDLISKNFVKDLLHFADHELLKFLQTNASY